jgi:hypothetical protein
MDTVKIGDYVQVIVCAGPGSVIGRVVGRSGALWHVQTENTGKAIRRYAVELSAVSKEFGRLHFGQRV